MLRSRHILIILPLAGLLAFASCEKNDLKDVKDAEAANAVPTEVSTNIDVIYSDSARVKARLRAPKMIRYISQQDPRMEMPNSLNVEFYDKLGKINSTLRSDYGIRYVNKNLTKVTGNVKVVNLKGDTLNTEEMFWDETKERVYSNKFVKVRTEKEVILAEGFESDVNFSKYTFYKIKGIISVKE